MEIRSIVILTGAGVSAESGLATFRGPDGLWEGHRVEDVCTPEAFLRDPALVHEFYDARRAKLGTVEPNDAHRALARLTGTEAPAMPDTEQNFAELKDRCNRTIEYLEGFDASALAGSEDREVQIIFPNGMGYRFVGAEYLATFALPNFYFHVTTAYAILRNAGVQLGKPDFLQHLGPPNIGA